MVVALPQRTVVIDTDPGIDDALALWLALASPELDVAAVLATAGNVGLERAVANAASIAALAGRTVPVHAGAPRPLDGQWPEQVRSHGADGLGGVVLPPGSAASPLSAVAALHARLRQATVPITLVGLGPVTNLALALGMTPELAGKVDEIVLMSGVSGTGDAMPSVEFNAGTDPHALAIVLASGMPVTFATLDLTSLASLTTTDIEDLAARDGRCARAAASMLRATAALAKGEGRPVHDACPIAWLLRPTLFTARACHARVVLQGAERGRTIFKQPDASSPANAHLLETVDRDGFAALLRERLARLP